MLAKVTTSSNDKHFVVSSHQLLTYVAYVIQKGKMEITEHTFLARGIRLSTEHADQKKARSS